MLLGGRPAGSAPDYPRKHQLQRSHEFPLLFSNDFRDYYTGSQKVV